MSATTQPGPTPKVSQGDKKMSRTADLTRARGKQVLLLAAMAAPLLASCHGSGPQGSPVAPAISDTSAVFE